MVESMLQQKIDIYSEKYNIVGIVKDYGLAVKLCFTYDGRDVEMGIRKPLFNEDTLENVGRQTIESYICNLAPRERVIMLHRWYIDEHFTDQGEYREGHGIVTGHPKIADACYMCTDDIKKVHTDLDFVIPTFILYIMFRNTRRKKNPVNTAVISIRGCFRTVGCGLQSRGF